MSMTNIPRFTDEIVPIAHCVAVDEDESAAPDGGGGFADYTLVSLCCLHMYLDTSDRLTIDCPKEMSQITVEIGLSAGDLRSLVVDTGDDKRALRGALRKLGCEALAWLRRARTYLVPCVPRDRLDVCRL